MFVVTADQIASRSGPDLVPAALAATHFALRGFERTVGDEIQGLYDDGAGLVADVLTLERTHNWRIGIGIGEISLPVPKTPRSGRGPAFILAREALEATQVKGAADIAIRGSSEQAAAAAQALLRLVSAIRSKRSADGWAVYDLSQENLSGAEMANRLGISPQAVSARLATAQVAAEAEALPALVYLLGEAA